MHKSVTGCTKQGLIDGLIGSFILVSKALRFNKPTTELRHVVLNRQYYLYLAAFIVFRITFGGHFKHFAILLNMKCVFFFFFFCQMH